MDELGRELGKTTYEDEYLQLNVLDDVKDFESLEKFCFERDIDTSNFYIVGTFIDDLKAGLAGLSCSFEMYASDALACGVLYESVKGQSYFNRRADVRKKLGKFKEHPCKNLDLQVATELISLFMLAEDYRCEKDKKYIRKTSNSVFMKIQTVLDQIGIYKELRSLSKAWKHAETFYAKRKSPHQMC